MLSLLLLPVDIWDNKIFCALSLRNICILDSAVQNHLLRRAFLSLLRFHQQTRLTIWRDLDIGFLDWIIARGIRFKSWEYHERSNLKVISVVQYMARNPPLQSIHLHSATGSLCASVATHCRFISEITIEDCVGLSAKSIELLAKCWNLNKLRLRRLSKDCNRALKRVFKSCVNLTVVEFEFVYLLADDSILMLTQHCRELSTLRIVSCGITGASALHLGKHCVNLKSLYLAGIKGNIDEGLVAIGSNCNLLVDLSMVVLKVSNSAIVAFCRQSPQLTSLHISRCAISRESLWGAANYLPSLRILAMQQISGVGDADILFVAKRLPFLSTLKLTVQSAVTDATLVKLRHSCLMLRTVEFKKEFGEVWDSGDHNRGDHYMDFDDIIALVNGYQQQMP